MHTPTIVAATRSRAPGRAFALTPIGRSDATALMPEDVSRQIIEDLPRASVLLANPAVTRRTMSRQTQRLPILSMLPTAYWVNPADTGTIAQTQQKWANKYITAEKLAVIVPIPKDVLADQDYDLWSEVRPRIVESVGAAFDGAVLFGTNAPSSFPDCISEGCDVTDHEVKTGTGVDFADDLNLAMGKVEKDGFDVNGHVARLTVKSKLRGLRSTTGEPIFQTETTESIELGGISSRPTIFSEPTLFSENGSWDPTQADIITGRWSEIFVGIRQDFMWEVLTEATIGGVNLAETDQVGLKVTFRAGWQLGNPPTRENPNDATRYPFAIVRPSGWVGDDGTLS